MSVAATPFIPHTLAHLTEARVFPQALPDAFYNKMLADYAALSDVRVSRITYDSDGLSVTGLMALPANIQPGAHPILLYNRGGSRNYGMLTLVSAMRSMVPFARAGHLVFASNYRGNDGSEGREEFGGADVNDVFNLLAQAEAQPGFDGKNRYLLGHSRGGMMTYLAMKRGAQLSAAISLAGLSDIRAGATLPHMVERVYRPLIPGFDDHAEASLAERSALCWPERLNAPLLLLHGDADESVPAAQSIALAQALETLGKPHALHIYPGANHALVRVWDDVVEKCLIWMKGYTL